MRTHPAPALAAALALAACNVGPDYKRPDAPTTATFKEDVTPAAYRAAGQWHRAQPNDGLPRGAWWRIFGDPRLDALETQVDRGNQDLRLAEARFRQARAAIGFQRAAEFPTLSVGGTGGALKDSAHQPYFLIPNPTAQGALTLPVDLSYEIDVWGQIRRTVAATREEAQATAGDLATVRLSLHAELAIDYIELRAADAQEKLLADTVTAYEKALSLTQSRLQGGAAPLSDVAQAQTQLDTARVQETDIGVQRAQYEHAIAILIGEPPAAFSLPPLPLDLEPPKVPPGLPSELLQRRPDIAAAERRMAEANEQIGIAEAAYYPSLNLSALAGFEGTTLATWFGLPSLFWAVGLSASELVYDGGRRKAQSENALAGYDAAVDAYRQTVLTAFQQVEDNLAALRILRDEAAQEKSAIDAAASSLRIFNNRYLGGQDAYINVVTAQEFLLSNQRNDVDLRRRRMEADILLVKALGGGWNADEIPALKGSGEADATAGAPG
ncbi:efflux transporter outer membrane subunit [Acidisphaera rubrifaciens]|uniref:Secretion system type I outer membrane efflux pump lipoprotein NodT n=1 Tax=Acidisphaera rubrifaciens HS-AP3 TaxID=1231350 RepID=A0A0D6P455_9PROT|nr:efflux transporter outer membrane subunit [Acidisphaera rubrifaciens]GAN76555.1 secretion system type I outer membrane efflux pump lipoprotein NodT [Acidisphaera rubrifaciens HS-AP3]